MPVFWWTLFGLAVGIGILASLEVSLQRVALAMSAVLEHIDPP